MTSIAEKRAFVATLRWEGLIASWRMRRNRPMFPWRNKVETFEWEIIQRVELGTANLPLPDDVALLLMEVAIDV